VRFFYLLEWFSFRLL